MIVKVHTQQLHYPNPWPAPCLPHPSEHCPEAPVSFHLSSLESFVQHTKIYKKLCETNELYILVKIFRKSMPSGKILKVSRVMETKFKKIIWRKSREVSKQKNKTQFFEIFTHQLICCVTTLCFTLYDLAYTHTHGHTHTQVSTCGCTDVQMYGYMYV